MNDAQAKGHDFKLAERCPTCGKEVDGPELRPVLENALFLASRIASRQRHSPDAARQLEGELRAVLTSSEGLPEEGER